MTRISLAFVNSFRDRHGRMRHYFRRPGCKSVPLPGLPGSTEFMEAYQVALAGVPLPPEIGASRTKPGTINAAIVVYYKSKAFTEALASETQRMRRNILERFRSDHGEKRIALLQRQHIVKLLEPMKPHAQRNWLKTIRGLMAFALAESMIAADPTEGVKPIKAAKSRGHMTWHAPQIAMYRNQYSLGTMARLAIEFMLNVGARRHDAHLLGYQHIRDGRICWRPHKTLRTTGQPLKIKIMPQLQEALDAMSRSENVLTFLTTEHGKPFASAAAFGNKFAKWCRAAGLQPVLCDDGKMRCYRAHGLRKAALTQASNNGATGPELQALGGFATLAQVQVYIAEADQERLADSAIAKRLGADEAKAATATYKPSAAKLQTGS